MIRKQNSLVSDREKVLMVWPEEQTSHHILLRQSLYQEQGTNSLQFCEGWEKWGGCRKNSEASRGCFTRFKERSHLHNPKVQSDIANTVAAAASYPEDLVKIIHEGGYTDRQMFDADETASLLEEDAVGLSYLESKQCLASKLQRTGWPSC